MHKRLEMSVDEYLEEVTTQLGSLPTERREEEMREIRQHLDEAVANSRKQGLSEEQAVAAALTRFGTPREAAESAIWAWRDHVRKVWSLFSVRFTGIWESVAIFLFLREHPHTVLLFWHWLSVFILSLPLLLALPLYLPRKYQPTWLYRYLANSRLAKIR